LIFPSIFFPPSSFLLYREAPSHKKCVATDFLCVHRQVETACRLQLSLSGKQPSEHLHQPLPEEAVSLQETPFGVFRLLSGDPFSEDKTVLWLGVQGLAFALVCDPDENLMLAEGALRLLAKALLEHLKLLTAGGSWEGGASCYPQDKTHSPRFSQRLFGILKNWWAGQGVKRCALPAYQHLHPLFFVVVSPQELCKMFTLVKSGVESRFQAMGDDPGCDTQITKSQK
uniref:Adaptor related protein complex 5 subunit sigma 1 n=1 Tax=Pseudonaja textilis TaxID=8673 RepID=A0A670YVM9_PSETE